MASSFDSTTNLMEPETNSHLSCILYVSRGHLEETGGRVLRRKNRRNTIVYQLEIPVQIAWQDLLQFGYYPIPLKKPDHVSVEVSKCLSSIDSQFNSSS